MLIFELGLMFVQSGILGNNKCACCLDLQENQLFNMHTHTHNTFSELTIFFTNLSGRAVDLSLTMVLR